MPRGRSRSASRAPAHHRRGGRHERPCSEEGRASPKRQASQPSRLLPVRSRGRSQEVHAREASVGSRAPPEWRRGASAGSSAELEVSDVSRLRITEKPEGIEGMTRWSHRGRPPRRRPREGSGCLEGAASPKRSANHSGRCGVPWWPRRGEAGKEPRVATRFRRRATEVATARGYVADWEDEGHRRRRPSHRARRRDA